MWKLNLRSSEPAQEAAIKVLDGSSEHATATPPTKTWSVHIVNLVTNESEVLWTGLTKKGVLMRMKLWRERRTDCILLPFPNFLPPPDFLPPRVQTERLKTADFAQF